MFNFWRVTRLMLVRNLIRWARNPAWLMVGLFQPILYLLLFAPLLDSLKMPGVEQGNALKFCPRTPGDAGNECRVRRDEYPGRFAQRRD